MCCSLTESDGWPRSGPRGRAFVENSDEGRTHSVRRGTGLVRRTDGQPREAPRVVVTEDRGHHEQRRLGDADRREGRAGSRPAGGRAGAGKSGVTARSVAGPAGVGRRLGPIGCRGVLSEGPRKSGPPTRWRRPSWNDAVSENSLALLRIRASRRRPSPCPRRRRRPGRRRSSRAAARVVATVVERVVRMVLVALVVTGARGVESTTADTLRSMAGHRPGGVPGLVVHLRGGGLRVVVDTTDGVTQRGVVVLCLHLRPDVVEQVVVRSAVGLGDTRHQGPPDGDEATEDQHGSQRTPLGPPVGGRRAHRDLDHGVQIPALEGHKRRNGQIRASSHHLAGPNAQVSRSGVSLKTGIWRSVFFWYVA